MGGGTRDKRPAVDHLGWKRGKLQPETAAIGCEAEIASAPAISAGYGEALESPDEDSPPIGEEQQIIRPRIT